MQQRDLKGLSLLDKKVLREEEQELISLLEAEINNIQKQNVSLSIKPFENILNYLEYDFIKLLDVKYMLKQQTNYSNPLSEYKAWINEFKNTMSYDFKEENVLDAKLTIFEGGLHKLKINIRPIELKEGVF